MAFMLLPSFRVSIVSPDLDFLPDNLYSIDLLINPMWGLYANMIGQLISQISSHWIIYYHRRVVEQAKKARHALFRKTASFLASNEDGAAGEGFLDERRGSSSSDSTGEGEEADARMDRLCQHAFVRPHSDNSKLVARGYVNPLLVVCALAFVGLLVAGCILPSFSVEILGILGLLVESGNGWEQAVQDHSVFSTAGMLMDQARLIEGVKDNIGLGSLSALLVFTVLIVPLIQTTALLYHWFAPMNKKRRESMAVLIETASAWQYMEVFLISTIVAAWQLGPVSDFMINAYCGSLADTFAMMVYYGIVRESDAQCFRVEAGIEKGAYILAAGAFLLGLMNSYIGNASRQYFRDIENKSKVAVVPMSRTYGNSSGADNNYVGEQDEEADWDENDPLAKPSGAKGNDDWRRSEAEKKIHPVPVLFTDKFRWTLRGADSALEWQDPTVVKDNNEPPTFNDEDTDPSEIEIQFFNEFIAGDAPDAMPSPSRSGAGSSEGWTDEDNSSDGGDKFKDEVIQVENLDEQWESGDEGNSNYVGTGTAVATVSDYDAYSMDQSQATGTSEYQSAREEDDVVLLGSGNVILRANPGRASNNERFDDELETVHDDDNNSDDDGSFASSDNENEQEARVFLPGNEPRRPQGNSLLQAAFMEDDLPSVS